MKHTYMLKLADNELIAQSICWVCVKRAAIEVSTQWTIRPYLITAISITKATKCCFELILPRPSVMTKSQNTAQLRRFQMALIFFKTREKKPNIAQHEPKHTREKLKCNVAPNPLLMGFFNCYIAIQRLFLEPFPLKNVVLKNKMPEYLCWGMVKKIRVNENQHFTYC